MLPAPVTYYMKYDAFTKDDISSVLHEYAANGVKYISLTCSLLGAVMGDPCCMATMQKALAEEGISFLDSHSIATHKDYDLNCPDPFKRHQMLARHKLGLWIGAEMGVRTMAFHPGFDFALEDFTIEKQIDLVSASLDELLPVAEKAEVTMCLENIWFAGCMPDVLLELKKRFPSPYFAFCYDSGHANIVSSVTKAQEGGWARFHWKSSGYEEPHWEDHALEKMLPYVVNCHLHDNNGLMDQHQIPGSGTVDWKKIVSLLRKAPNLRVIHAEINPSPEQSIGEITKAFRAIGEL